MAESDFTLIDDDRVVRVAATCQDDRVRLSPAVLHRTLGWELKAQGLCKDDRCVPIGGRADLVNRDGVDLEGFAELLERPLALDVAERIACLGAPTAERAARLASLEAPDFTLPDLTGRMHALSDYRGRKVLLVAYASW